MDAGTATDVPEASRARFLTHAVRKPSLERAHLPEEFVAPLLAAAVHDPDPSFCRWFVETALYTCESECFCHRAVWGVAGGVPLSTWADVAGGGVGVL